MYLWSLCSLNCLKILVSFFSSDYEFIRNALLLLPYSEKKMSKKEKMEKEIKKTSRERYRRTNANAEKNYVIIVDGKK